MNTGFLNRATEILAAQPSHTNSNLWKLNMERGYPYSVGVLSEFTVDLLVHFNKGGPALLCNKMYFAADDPESACIDCEKPGYQNQGTNRPGLVRCLIGYVFDLVDKKDTTKSGKEFSHNPLKIVEVGAGRGQANLTSLNEAIAGGYLVYQDTTSPNIWKIKRKLEEEGGGMAEPGVLSNPELKKLGSQFKTHVPKDILQEWSSKSKEEVLGYILSSYGNLHKDLLVKEGVIFPDKDEAPKGDSVDSSLDS